MSDLDTARDYIRETGPTEVARQTGIERRTLQYLINGKGWPNYQTIAKVLDAKKSAHSGSNAVISSE